MSLYERTVVHAEEFSLDGFKPLYVRRGLGPSTAGSYAIPQKGSCVIRRLITRMYVLNHIDSGSRPPLIWPVRAPQRIAIVDLRDEHLCFRMANLAFFEEGLRLSTIVNAQVPWLAFESPLITRLSGTGRVGIRIDGKPDCYASAPVGSPPQRINLLRLAAWASDTRFTVEFKSGYSNTVLMAPATAVVHSSSLVLAGRDDHENDGSTGLLMRVGRLVVP